MKDSIYSVRSKSQPVNIKVNNNRVLIEGSLITNPDDQVHKRVFQIIQDILETNPQKGIKISMALHNIDIPALRLLNALMRLLNNYHTQGVPITFQWYLTDAFNSTDIGLSIQGKSLFEFNIVRAIDHLVLIIEPSFLTRELLKMQYHGTMFELAFAANGMEAMTLLHQTKYDLIVTESNLDYISGWEIIDYLSTIEFDSIPIIMLTDQATIDHGRSTCKRPNLYFKAKPFDPMSLKSYIVNLLEDKSYHEQLVS